MNEDHPDQVEFLAELLWWRWSDGVRRDDWYPALKNVIDKNDELRWFLEDQIEQFEETNDSTWGEFQNTIQRNIFDHEAHIDWPEIYSTCIDEYYKVRARRYD